MSFLSDILKRYSVIAVNESPKILDEVKKALEGWTAANPTQDKFKKLLQLESEIPEKFKKVTKKIYRGEPLTPATVQNLLSKKPASVLGVSWSFNKSIAEIFGSEFVFECHKQRYGIIWEYQPSPNEILLNHNAFLDQYPEKTKRSGEGEQEVILNRLVTMTTKNIVKIYDAALYSTEYPDAKTLPQELTKYLEVGEN
jgi:hypothetical protein